MLRPIEMAAMAQRNQTIDLGQLVVTFAFLSTKTIEMVHVEQPFAFTASQLRCSYGPAVLATKLISHAHQHAHISSPTFIVYHQSNDNTDMPNTIPTWQQVYPWLTIRP